MHDNLVMSRRYLSLARKNMKDLARDPLLVGGLGPGSFHYPLKFGPGETTDMAL